MKTIANDINDAIKQSENRQKILEIQESFVNPGGLTFLEAPRLFLKDGPLMKVCRKTPKQRWLFLFNDILVYATKAGSSAKRNTFYQPTKLELHYMRLDDVADTDTYTFAFQIVSRTKSFVVYGTCAEEKVSWMSAINNAVEDCKARKLSYQRGSSAVDDEQPGLEAPIFTPDAMAKKCELCSVGFTFINRRHHCRVCGACICGACSGHQLYFKEFGKVRVCEKCFEQKADKTGDSRREKDPDELVSLGSSRSLND